MNILAFLYLFTTLVWLVGALGAVFAYRAFRQTADFMAALAFLVLAAERAWQARAAFEVVTLGVGAPDMLTAGLAGVGAVLLVTASRMRRVVVI